MKICKKCGINQEETNYSKGKSICKTCASESFKKWWEKQKETPSLVLPEKKICSVCKLEFPIGEFYIRRDRNRPISRCKKCDHNANKKSWMSLSVEEKKKRIKENREWKNEQIKSGNLKVFLSSKLNSYKATAEKKGVPFGITVQYLIDLFKKQNGKCYYTNIPLTMESNRGLGKRIVTLKAFHYQASLDRLIPENGYVEGNVVWCGWLVNTCKNMLTENQFYEFCQQVLTTKQTRD